MIKLIIFYFCITTSILFSQTQPAEDGSFNELAFFVSSKNPIYDNTEGSRYLNDEFVPVEIVNIKGTKLVRFNTVENTIEVRKENGDIMLLSLVERYSIKLLDGSKRQYVTRSYVNEKQKEVTTFFEILYGVEKFKLYVKERVLFRKGKPEKSSYEKAVPAKFVKGKDIFYVATPDVEQDGLQKIPTKKKLFYKFFGNQEKSVKQFVKNEKLSIDNEDDLVKILDFYYK